MPKKITMSAVGKAVGVSTATVSYVLNGRGGELRIDPATQEQVLKTAQRMGYKLPQSVGQGRRQIGVLYPNMMGDYMGLQIAGIQEVLRQYNYHSVFCVCDDDPKVEKIDLDMYLRRKVQGLIAFPCEDAEAGNRWAAYLKRAENVVFIGRHPAGLNEVSCIEVDNRQVGREAAEILIREGRKNFVVVREHPEVDPLLEERRQGFLHTLREWSEVSIREIHWRDFPAVMHALSEPEENTGIYTVRNSLLFPSVYMALKRRMVTHPDIVFAGIGSMDRAYALPNRFWVARHPAREMGHAAAQMLLTALGEVQGYPPGRHTMLMKWDTNLLLEQHFQDPTAKPLSPFG